MQTVIKFVAMILGQFIGIVLGFLLVRLISNLSKKFTKF